MAFLKPLWVTAMACGLVGLTVAKLQAAPAGGGGHAHVHPDKGPHDGALIELGKEDYHAELIHDAKTDTVTVYLLDASATKPVSIPAQQLTLNIRAGGKPQQFHLPATPRASDPDGSSAAFAVTNRQLCQALDAPGASGRLNVEIAGKVYVGKVGSHAHSHPH
ncbi:MAG: hypothetical protein WD060_09865 [Pirellulales bacterium]